MRQTKNRRGSELRARWCLATQNMGIWRGAENADAMRCDLDEGQIPIHSAARGSFASGTKQLPVVIPEWVMGNGGSEVGRGRREEEEKRKEWMGRLRDEERRPESERVFGGSGKRASCWACCSVQQCSNYYHSVPGTCRSNLGTNLSLLRRHLTGTWLQSEPVVGDLTSLLPGRSRRIRRHLHLLGADARRAEWVSGCGRSMVGRTAAAPASGCTSVPRNMFCLFPLSPSC
ncbi:hypothetical protein BGZ61DRAFT_24900 [Ilyonectria robusta]|uniref:uncharacterized protein n=1 Tax=Ilyonectria robusta TaxID=1079257 RepID=UPI001E8D666D|nr:uncharacterized protein BGZ61DRAFT_24900 [Ilyonectria robusta]KAH8737917.1 hypothetical protein BGZ61DRAFT_24900 [Ilyonectria robusta]